MTAEIIFDLLFLVAFAAFAVHGYVKSRERKRMFAACGERLGFQNFKQTATSISGRVRDMEIDVRFVAGTKSSPSHTTIDVSCSPCALLLHLRPQSESEVRAVRQGEALDVTLGDPEFDAAWIIEGAPAERVVRLLSSPPIRAQIMDLSRVDKPSIKIEDGHLSLYREGTEVGATEVATERIQLALALAEAVIADATTPLPAGDVDGASSTYRTVRRFDLDASGPTKIAELKIMRAKRAIRDLRPITIALGTITTGLILATQLARGIPSIALVAPLLLFALVWTIAVLSRYRAETKNAPGVPRDDLMLGWTLACWILNIAVTLRAILQIL